MKMFFFLLKISMGYNLKPENYMPFYKINPWIRNNLNWDIYNDTPSNKWSTEHVTPKSFLTDKDQERDLYNLFNTNPIINSHRSNYKFTNILEINKNLISICSTGSIRPAKHIDTFAFNYKNNKKKLWLPSEKSRGPLARSIAYMFLTYPDIDQQNIIDTTILKRWLHCYKVQTWEIKHMWKIYALQGNINPFILYN